MIQLTKKERKSTAGCCQTCLSYGIATECYVRFFFWFFWYIAILTLKIIMKIGLSAYTMCWHSMGPEQLVNLCDSAWLWAHNVQQVVTFVFSLSL